MQIPRREADNHQYVQYKIVLFGVSKVGKTSIVDYFMYNRFEELPYHMNTVSLLFALYQSRSPEILSGPAIHELQ